VALFGGLTRFLDKYLFGYALGVAAGPSLEPFVQPLANDAWRANQVLPPEYALLAKGVAEEKIDHGWAVARAAEQGISGDAFDRLVTANLVGPGSAYAFQLWRRGLIDEAGFREALRDDGVRPKWIDRLVELRDVLLTPAELANAVVQGHRDIGPATVDATKQGLRAPDFQTMVDNTGLPPGPETLLDWLRRGVIDDAEFAQGVREGHTKTKYVEPFRETRWRLLAATEWAGLWLRGWVTEAQAKAGGALVGYDGPAMDLLYRNRGRPATTRQVHIGYARGGRLAGAANEEEAFRKAVAQSNIRTEYADVLWASRYTYPSAFVVRALAQEGTFDHPTTVRILVESGWNPTYAELAADSWTGGTAAAPSAKWLNRARTSMFTRTHTEYTTRQLTRDEALQGVTAAGVASAEANAVVDLWTRESDLIRTELTQAQIVKAFKKGYYDEVEALSELVERGLTDGDARIRLGIG
jgi:hypothetical protein